MYGSFAAHTSVPCVLSSADSSSSLGAAALFMYAGPLLVSVSRQRPIDQADLAESSSRILHEDGYRRGVVVVEGWGGCHVPGLRGRQRRRAASRKLAATLRRSDTSRLMFPSEDCQRQPEGGRSEKQWFLINTRSLLLLSIVCHRLSLLSFIYF